ncbi:hypothetical protein G5B31_06350 [Rhodobacter sp. SGA-6-6]|uniref:hypothetical protein n=1 Tax=Rhodobacter sp. SGA-6-6 TaxID=2710882 RepID=UPI0013EB7E86|nr:hypothetical protein [Rhodobacter sp. SGA-6-6]NGM45155.1 hypothetical protein [Rhodobacter sp. SGA-6-6]
MQSLVVAVKECVDALKISGKCGEKILKPAIQNHLTRLGLEADAEDRSLFLGAQLPVWRSKDTREIEVTAARRKIDLVVRQDGKVIGLIETESDLNDLRPVGVTRRNGHYDVYSIARDARGAWFHSYKSLERMAAALWYDAGLAPDALPNVQSDDPGVHNPKGLDCILVTGRCRPSDQAILAPRLLALGATLIGAS